jgi:hypothetical protein
MEPKSLLRVKDANAAHDLFVHAVEQNKLLFRNLETVENFVEGANPDSPEHLKEQGGGEQSNINFGGAESLCGDLENLLWNRTYGEPTLATIIPTSIDDAVSRLTAGQAASERFTYLLGSLPFFRLNSREHIENYIRTGRGFRFFPDAVSLRDEILHFSDLLLPANCPVDPTKWETFFIRRFETVSRLFSLVRDPETEEASRSEGYDTSEIRRILFTAQAKFSREEEIKAKQKLVADFSEQHPLFLSYWEGIENNSLVAEFQNTELLPVVYHFVKEFDGKWSVYAFCNLPDFPEGGRKFYRQELSKYESIYQILIPSFYAPRRAANATKSLVLRAYNELSVNNDILNSLVDFLPWLTSLIAEKDTTEGEPKAAVVRNKGNVITLENARVNASAMQAIRGGEALGIYKVLQSVTEGKRKYSPSNLGSNLGSVQPISKEEIETLNANVSDAQVSLIQIRDAQEVHYYRELFRRVMAYPTSGEEFSEQVSLFWKSLASDGVRKSDLTNACIEVTPSIGYGNTQARAAAIREVLTSADQLGIDPYGRQRLSRLFISARLGADAARDVLPPNGRPRPTVSEREAHKENLFLSMGQPVPVLAEDDHQAHFLVAYQGIVSPILAVVEQGQTPNLETAYRALAATIPHLQGHQQFITKSGSREAAAQALGTTERLFADIRRAVEAQQAQQAQQAEQQAQQQLSETQMKAELERYKIELAAANKRLDVVNQNETRMMKTLAKIEADQLRNLSR